MAGIKTVGIKELKNNLSAYLRDVRRGARILVSDRNVVVAELREPGAAYGPDEPLDPIVEEWVQKGLATLPTRPKTARPSPSHSLPLETILRALAEERGDR